MDKQQAKLTKENLKFFQTDRNISNKSIIRGSLIAITIASTPFLFYLYEYAPEGEIWETWFFTYKSGFYENVQIGLWSILMKLVPLLLLFLWFFTCRHWWYHAILVPIAMFSYQIFGAINAELINFDESQLLYLVPLMAFIIPSIYLIRAKMFNKINTADKTLSELEEEFMIKPKGLWSKIKQYF
ncbi:MULTISPECIES: hypothetical protein [Winogradskyella]|uniref:hypothetical protein n=1 Tax=Winogradskyella TaxID=286104 RepID=UPI001C545219|nr:MULTISPECIES: hypothetical protein [Winogradskyella]